jgi:hypothetical protein
VRKAITRALDVIAATDPEVAAVLRARIRTGYRCMYEPNRPSPLAGEEAEARRGGRRQARSQRDEACRH